MFDGTYSNTRDVKTITKIEEPTPSILTSVEEYQAAVEQLREKLRNSGSKRLRAEVDNGWV